MVTVQRANVVLQIKESEVDRMVSLGYNVLGDNGEVIREAVPKSVEELTRAYNEHVAKIAELEAEIQKLKTPVTTVKKKKSEATE